MNFYKVLRIDYKSFIPFLILLIFSGCSQTNITRPNIILIIGDDHGYPYFGFMGSEIVSTPNMDALARSGTLFTNGYVPDNHCRPALQSLITGIDPYNFKIQRDSIRQLQKKEQFFIGMDKDSKDQWENNFNYHAMKYFDTVPAELKKLGYKSFQSGKWWEYHFEYGGFSEGMTKGWVREKRDGRNWFQQFMGGEGTDIGRVTNQPVYDFIEKNQSNPFFIWYAPQLPHYPFDAPNKYRGIYKNKGYSKSAVEYYANCTWFDDSVGELISHLKNKDLFDNTLFIYVNDNGWEQEPYQEFINDPMRSHNGGDKGKLSIFDQSFRTPIIFSWKNKIKSNIQLDDLIHTIDISATILDYADEKISPSLGQGKSFKKVIEGMEKGSRNIILGQSNKIRDTSDPMGKDVEAYWSRDKNWFYKFNITDNKEELYDALNDPKCMVNIIESHKDVARFFNEKIGQKYSD
ncbi:MAG: sulfatase [Candidatus Neomarinimicrobiota bacterium]